MPRVREDAGHGVSLARIAWRKRDPSGAAKVLGHVIEPKRQKRGVLKYRQKDSDMTTKATVKSKPKRTAMTAKRQAAIDDRLSQMPESSRRTYIKAVKGKGLRASINAMCQECCGWQRVEVHLCTDLGCPLYAVRPYQQLKRQSDVN